MNTCIISTFNCTFDDFKNKVEEQRPEWSKFVDDYEIVKVNEHKSIMLMNVLDFEPMQEFMTTEEMQKWDAENGCVDKVYSMSQ